MKFVTAVAQASIVGVLTALAGPAAAQQDYPNKPIRIVTPYAPGGSTSVLARLIGQKLTESWGQQTLVDNRPGGNTIIGTEAVAKSPADGYTILLTSNIHVISPNLNSSLPYDPVRDFAPVATLVNNELVLVVHPSVPANTLREFIALAKARPGQLNYASSGTGGAVHLATEMFSVMTGAKMQHIPYKGGGPAVIDLIAGQVQLSINVPTNFIQHIKSGKLKPIAISGEARMAALPQVPTFTEAGLAGLNIALWQGILAPARTQGAIIDKLSTEIAKILAMPDTQEFLAKQGSEPFISTPDQFAALIKADLAKFAKIIKTANIKLEN